MIIGIEICTDRLRAMCFDRFGAGRQPQRTVEIPCCLGAGPPAKAARALAEPVGRLMRELDPRKDAMAVAIPSAWCRFRAVSLPYRSVSRVEGTLRYALEGRLPGRIEDYVVEPVTEIIPAGENGARVLVAACSSETVRELLDAFSRVGAEPCILQPAVVSLARYAAETSATPPADAALLVRFVSSVVELAWMKEGELQSCQVVWLGDLDPGRSADRDAIAERVGIAVRAYDVSDGALTCTEAVLLAPDAVRDTLAESLRVRLNMPVSALPPGPADGAWAAAWGVAWEAAHRKHLAASLRRGEHAFRPYARKRERQITAALILAVGIVGASLWHTGGGILEMKRNIKSDVQSQVRLFREVGGTGPPSIRGMEAALKKAERLGGRSGRAEVASCLRHWTDLMRHVPGNAGIRFDVIDIKQGGITLTARAPRAASAWRFRDALKTSRAFAPDSPMVTKSHAGGVTFTVQLRYRR